MVSIRPETASDHDKVLTLVHDAFWNMYMPGCDEHLVVHKMHTSPDTIPEMTMVAVDDTQTILGYIGGTRATIGTATEVATLGPLAVSRSCHSKGVGTSLVKTFVDKAKSMGFPCVCVQGYPSYYERFGTVNAQTLGVHLPDKSQPFGFQIIPLAKDIPKGAYVESDVFGGLTPEAIEALESEKSFPFKEKKEGTKSQQMFAMIYPLAYNDKMPPEFDPKACNNTG